MRTLLVRATISVGTLVMVLQLGTWPVSATNFQIPVKVYLNKTGKKTKFVSKGTFTVDPNNDATTAGGRLEFCTASDPNGDVIVLGSALWSSIAGGAARKYHDANGLTCKTVLVKQTVIKALCKTTTAGQAQFDPNDEIQIRLRVGSSDRYCAACPGPTGQQRGNPTKLTKFKDCDAPTTCGCAGSPSGAFVDG